MLAAHPQPAVQEGALSDSRISFGFIYILCQKLWPPGRQAPPEGASGSSGAPCCFKSPSGPSRPRGSWDRIPFKAQREHRPPLEVHQRSCIFQESGADGGGGGALVLRLFLIPPPLHPEWRTRPPSLGWTTEDKHLPKRDMLRIAHEHHDAPTVVENKERHDTVTMMLLYSVSPQQRASVF